jgi:hypothetical protein
MIAKVIAAVFAALVLVKSYDEFRRGREPIAVFLFWLTTWAAVLVVAFWPGITDVIREKILGPGAGLGTIFGIAIVFLLYLSYRIYLKADRNEEIINRLISELAIRDVRKEQSSKK